MSQQTGYTVLNQFPREQYNVLIPVQSLQAISAMQKIVVNRVELDTRIGKKKVWNKKQNREIEVESPIGNDIYKERNGDYAITKVGGMKLAAAANISIIKTEKNTPEACQRCFELAAATRAAPSCGSCISRFNASYTVTIRVPELSGGFRLISGTKEIDVELEKERMYDAQFKEYLPNVAAQAESKAFMRALRMALGLQGTYPYDEIKKPFIVAHVVPDLDNPAIQQLAAQNMLQSMGMLFETSDGGQHAALPAHAQSIPESNPMSPDHPAQLPPAQHVEQTAETSDDIPDFLRDDDLLYCEECSSAIMDSNEDWPAERIAEYSIQHFGKRMCKSCQREELKRGGTQ